MRKKVIDIYPPSGEGTVTGNVHAKEKRERGGKGKWILGLLFLLVIVGGYLYYSSYGTVVVASPSTVTIEEARELLVRGSGSVGTGEVRGILLSETLEGSREFPIEETRTMEERAEGEIKVCQDYSDSPRKYVERTRFISDEGKLFEATESFVLPGVHENDGCAWVDAIAAETGEDYNLSENSSFALPGLEGTGLYGRVKGKSFNLKKEGFSKEVPYLDERTMENAEKEMLNELSSRGRERIDEEYGENYYLGMDAQYTAEVIERDFEEKEDEDTFDFKLRIRVRAMGIEKDSVYDFIYEILPEDHTWRKEDDKISFNLKRINFEDKEGDATMNFYGEIYKDIDRERVKREIIGLDFKEAEKVLREELEVDDLSIRTFPFGLSRVANNPDRIRIELDF